MPFDLDKFLKDEIGLSDQEIVGMRPKFEAKATQLAARFAASEDLEAAQADLETKSKELTAEIAGWSRSQALDADKRRQAEDRYTQVAGEVAQLRAKITSMAEEQGIDPATVLPTLTTPITKPEEKPTDPDPRYVQAEHVARGFDVMLTAMADLPAISQEHFELTGQRLDTRALVNNYKGLLAKGQAVSLQQVWESQNNIPAARTTAQKAQYDADLKTARDEGYQQARSEAALPTGSPGRLAPVFHVTNVTDGSKLQRPQPQSSVESAAAALASGKYKPKAVTH